jgi:SAM-dependent methyltransferase
VIKAGASAVGRWYGGRVEADHMRRFWDERAREDAYFFVDNRRAYQDPELESFWSEGERDLDRILALADVTISSTDTVVDIGCGVGRLTRPIAARAGRVYALDISSEMLARARTHHADLANVEWVVGDGVSLKPVADGSVDACVSHVTFQHIPDPTITLGYVSDMGRVLRPGGWAAFQVSNYPSVHQPRSGPRAQLDRLLSGLGRAPRGQHDPAWLGSPVDLEELRDVAVLSGLEVERVVGEGTLLCLVSARRTANGAHSTSVR